MIGMRTESLSKGYIRKFNYRLHSKRVLELDNLTFAYVADTVDQYPDWWWEQHDGYVYFDKTSRQIVGYIMYDERNSDLCPDKGIIYIELVGVDPEFQGQGIGTQLIQHLLRRADVNDQICAVELIVENNRPQNIKFYQKNGFVLSNHRDIKQNYDANNTYTNEYSLLLRKPNGQTIGTCILCKTRAKTMCVECLDVYCKMCFNKSH